MTFPRTAMTRLSESRSWLRNVLREGEADIKSKRCFFVTLSPTSQAWKMSDDTFRNDLFPHLAERIWDRRETAEVAGQDGWMKCPSGYKTDPLLQRKLDRCERHRKGNFSFISHWINLWFKHGHIALHSHCILKYLGRRIRNINEYSKRD
jgi:hypothetical protein